MIMIKSLHCTERTTTGIEHLDYALKGGIPIPSLVLLLGDVGTGKSVICQQFIYRQAKLGFKSVYFCVDHQPEEVRENMQTLGWYTEELEQKKLLKFEELSSLENQSFEGLKADVIREVRMCKRFVFDSISSIAFIYGERKAYDLLQKIKRICRENRGVGMVNAVRGMHSKTFEIAIQQICCSVIALKMKKDGRYLRVIKTLRTGHTTEEFGIEIVEEKGVSLI